jgi:hypothetical protein
MNDLDTAVENEVMRQHLVRFDGVCRRTIAAARMRGRRGSELIGPGPNPSDARLKRLTVTVHQRRRCDRRRWPHSLVMDDQGAVRVVRAPGVPDTTGDLRARADDHFSWDHKWPRAADRIKPLKASRSKPTSYPLFGLFGGSR